jgi:hypothetical protein
MMRVTGFPQAGACATLAERVELQAQARRATGARWDRSSETGDLKGLAQGFSQSRDCRKAAKTQGKHSAWRLRGFARDKWLKPGPNQPAPSEWLAVNRM